MYIQTKKIFKSIFNIQFTYTEIEVTLLLQLHYF